MSTLEMRNAEAHMDFRQKYDSWGGNHLHQKVPRRRSLRGPREQQEHYDRWYGDNSRPSEPNKKDPFGEGEEDELHIVKSPPHRKPPPEES